MAENKVEGRFESLSELEQIEGNYYKMDFFVACALVVFTVWVFMAEKNNAWAVLLGVLAVLFFIRGVRNWKEKTLPARARAGNERENAPGERKP